MSALGLGVECKRPSPVLKSSISRLDLPSSPRTIGPKHQGDGLLGISLCFTASWRFHLADDSLLPQPGEFRIPHSTWEDEVSPHVHLSGSLVPFWHRLSHSLEPHSHSCPTLRTNHGANGSPSEKHAYHLPQNPGGKSSSSWKVYG